jgi:hypothetical protein
MRGHRADVERLLKKLQTAEPEGARDGCPLCQNTGWRPQWYLLARAGTRRLRYPITPEQALDLRSEGNHLVYEAVTPCECVRACERRGPQSISPPVDVRQRRKA